MDTKNNRDAASAVITDRLWRALGKGFDTIDDAKQALTRRLVNEVENYLKNIDWAKELKQLLRDSEIHVQAKIRLEPKRKKGKKRA